MIDREETLAILRSAAGDAHASLAYKEQLIRDALLQGISARAIGRAVGMSHTGILKMKRRLGV